MTDTEDLLLLAESPSWRDRCRAGRELVARIGEPPVDEVILRLVLDSQDTAVTTATADALLDRGDVSSWQIFARAWTLASTNLTDTDHIDHLVS